VSGSDGKVAVVTGASSGLGAEVALLLAKRGFGRLVLVNRSLAGSEDTLARLRGASPDAAVEVVEADLADQDQVRAAAERIGAHHPRIDALFNNAGVLLPEPRPSRHGNDLHLQVNVLAPYMLTRLLRAPLAAAGSAGRVLNVSSGSVWLAGRLRVDELREPRRGGLTGAYARSKLALTALTNAMAPDYAASSGTALRSADPGGNDTKMTRGGGMPAGAKWLAPLLLKSPEVGAGWLVEAALDPRFGDRGGLFVAAGRERRPPRDADDPSIQAALLRLCGELTGI
jgi:NAD(P)-dependent dehydrogenase (short-subunit alcohol dehydrogenase family)